MRPGVDVIYSVSGVIIDSPVDQTAHPFIEQWFSFPEQILMRSKVHAISRGVVEGWELRGSESPYLKFHGNLGGGAEPPFIFFADCITNHV